MGRDGGINSLSPHTPHTSPSPHTPHTPPSPHTPHTPPSPHSLLIGSVFQTNWGGYSHREFKR
ncbi:MAG: hypothetical protein RM338_31260 [Nostoc sp. DedQUE12a]|nr:hypothetical protein [Nostoc sp. DedQUE12a]